VGGWGRERGGGGAWRGGTAGMNDLASLEGVLTRLPAGDEVEGTGLRALPLHCPAPCLYHMRVGPCVTPVPPPTRPQGTFVGGIVIGFMYNWRLALVIFSFMPVLAICGALMKVRREGGRAGGRVGLHRCLVCKGGLLAFTSAWHARAGCWRSLVLGMQGRVAGVH
jgi:hypothetical protein